MEYQNMADLSSECSEKSQMYVFVFAGWPLRSDLQANLSQSFTSTLFNAQWIDKQLKGDEIQSNTEATIWRCSRNNQKNKDVKIMSGTDLIFTYFHFLFNWFRYIKVDKSYN